MQLDEHSIGSGCFAERDYNSTLTNQEHIQLEPESERTSGAHEFAGDFVACRTPTLPIVPPSTANRTGSEQTTVNGLQ